MANWRFASVFTLRLVFLTTHSTNQNETLCFDWFSLKRAYVHQQQNFQCRKMGLKQVFCRCYQNQLIRLLTIMTIAALVNKWNIEQVQTQTLNFFASKYLEWPK